MDRVRGAASFVCSSSDDGWCTGPRAGIVYTVVWPFLFFGGFFFSGWLIRGREHMIDMEARHIWGLVLLMVAAFVVYYASMRSWI